MLFWARLQFALPKVKKLKIDDFNPFRAIGLVANTPNYRTAFFIGQCLDISFRFIENRMELNLKKNVCQVDVLEADYSFSKLILISNLQTIGYVNSLYKNISNLLLVYNEDKHEDIEQIIKTISKIKQFQFLQIINDPTNITINAK